MTRGVVIVTGGTFGLGREITLCLAAKGYSVVAFGLETPQVSSTAQNAIPGLRAEAEAHGLDVALLEADVSDETDVAHVLAATLERYGRIDGLVNNAAIGPLGTILDTEPDLWNRIVAVNLRGPYLMARAVIPHMAEQGGGCIVNVGSGAGWGKENMAAYATTKGGIIALSAAMALDHFHDRIRVNTVIPGGGGIVAGMSLGRVQGDRTKLGPDAVGTVAGRVANGTDLGNAIAYLMSPEAEAVSGTIIDVGCFAHQGSSTPNKRKILKEKT
ncbi:SDR family NAD(P)-dependent oxidoreductase [Roseobacter sp. N2S]|jgi:NAD(P)-dependent dehydrogenase (short-subunit alcohol dehydrogenase family)|uniref:SDR family NAD(P)-dependent oxidoreductase n=1 Tax=Roseobacter sp. N2S TaxID=2663844 RepID=UPI0013B3CA71|nr:SDR family oxidoreductase [Roseobacter sp. N2S]MDR6267472.1 NAD(P)-dependent dehydrogenase (short-subunit alcohol dehydrogenase family) [Roseobacter sp. N2S]